MAQDIRMKNPAHPGGFCKNRDRRALGAIGDRRRAGARHHAGGSLGFLERTRIPFA